MPSLSNHTMASGCAAEPFGASTDEGDDGSARDGGLGKADTEPLH